jgi:hypothetical protein
MNEKYLWSGIIVIMIFIAFGAYKQIQNRECFELSREESYVIYNDKLGGSFTQVPVKITYQCKDGRVFIR